MRGRVLKADLMLIVQIIIPQCGFVCVCVRVKVLSEVC